MKKCSQLQIDAEPDFQYRPPFINWTEVDTESTAKVYLSDQLHAFLHRVTKKRFSQEPGPYSLFVIEAILKKYINKLRSQTETSSIAILRPNSELHALCGCTEIPWKDLLQHFRRHLLVASVSPLAATGNNSNC